MGQTLVQKILAKATGKESVKVGEVIEPKVAQYFDDLMYYLDDPIGDFSIFPTYLVSRLARKNFTVMLSGDGADSHWYRLL